MLWTIALSGCFMICTSQKLRDVVRSLPRRSASDARFASLTRPKGRAAAITDFLRAPRKKIRNSAKNPIAFTFFDCTNHETTFKSQMRPSTDFTPL